MLVKKGQNNKIINLHDKTVIYIKFCICTSIFVYMQQDSFIHIRICLYMYTARLVYVHQDSCIFIKIRQLTEYESTFQMYRNIKIRVCTLRFVHIQLDPGIQ